MKKIEKMSADPTLDIVPTRAMLLKKSSEPTDFKAVVFETYKSKKGARSKLAAAKLGTNSGKDDEDAFDMKKARYEVFNFGISGYDFKDQQKAKIALAVKLGAKPPKSAYKNYKELQSERKEAKEKAAEEAYIRTVGKNSLGQATVSCNKLVNRVMKKKKANNKVGELTQHYGVINPKIHKKKKKK